MLSKGPNGDRRELVAEIAAEVSPELSEVLQCALVPPSRPNQEFVLATFLQNVTAERQAIAAAFLDIGG